MNEPATAQPVRETDARTPTDEALDLARRLTQQVDRLNTQIDDLLMPMTLRMMQEIQGLPKGERSAASVALHERIGRLPAGFHRCELMTALIARTSCLSA